MKIKGHVSVLAEEKLSKYPEADKKGGQQILLLEPMVWKQGWSVE